MSREIKFRAWVRPGGRFREGMHDWQGIIDTIELESGFQKSLLRFGTDPEYRDRVILMQFTGLKDKHGVEIYESDRVAFTERRSKTGIVTWYNGCLYVKGDDGWLQDFMSDQEGDGSEFEVIGNIYESPELVK
jgi:uncharacterized phage protein (TIGR01671 family)